MPQTFTLDIFVNFFSIRLLKYPLQIFKKILLSGISFGGGGGNFTKIFKLVEIAFPGLENVFENLAVRPMSAGLDTN